MGIENQGLNRWGLNLVGSMEYEGTLIALAEEELELTAALESRDGNTIYAEITLKIPGDRAWHQLDFPITPSASDPAGRLALKLKQPGAVWLDYVFLQPGQGGRFKGLPVRREIGQGLVDEGLTVLRYGGHMINTDWEHERAALGQATAGRKASARARTDHPTWAHSTPITPTASASPISSPTARRPVSCASQPSTPPRRRRMPLTWSPT